MDSNNANRKILLNNGSTMPVFGLGLFLMNAETEVESAMTSAVDAGYRHFDTAFVYQNEAAMGKVFRKLIDEKKVRREELFITSKLPNNGLMPENLEYFFNKSLKDMQLDYMDLYLIHFPVPCERRENDYEFRPTKDGVYCAGPDVDLLDTWKVMESLVDRGLTKAIGLSNFNSEQIKRIYDNARIKPAVLQVECHAYHAQFQLHQFCKDRNIAFTAYSPIGAPGSLGANQPLLQDPQLKPLCDKYGKSPAQILLRYLIQRDIIVIPKSANPKRIQENIQIFDFSLSDDDMTTLKSMNKNARLFAFTTPPGVVEHPEYPYKIPF